MRRCLFRLATTQEPVLESIVSVDALPERGDLLELPGDPSAHEAPPHASKKIAAWAYIEADKHAPGRLYTVHRVIVRPLAGDVTIVDLTPTPSPVYDGVVRVKMPGDAGGQGRTFDEAMARGRDLTLGGSRP